MHLLFARFLARFLYQEHIVPSPEPFNHLITQGMVLGETYINKATGAYEHPENVEKKNGQWIDKKTGDEVEVKFLKMSKSKHNGIDPVDVINQYGSDVVRVGMLMQCPPANPFLYSKSIMNPAMNILNSAERVCKVCIDQCNQEGGKLNLVEISKANNKVIHDMNAFNFHNVIANINIMLNHLERASFCPPYLQYTKNVLLFLSPFAPIKTEKLWTGLIEANCINKEDTFDKQVWPKEIKVNSVMAIIQVRLMIKND